MANQFGTTPIPEEDRLLVLGYYESGIGIDTMVKKGLSPYGHNITKRIVRESKVPPMPRGNQPKYKDTSPDRKTCRRCGIEKPKDSFGVHSCTKDGLKVYCRPCRVELNRERSLLKDYGLTLEAYDAMFLTQKGLCACCEQPETSRKRTNRLGLSVDHDHVTGEVRQLLCHRCNLALGLLQDDPELCSKMQKYATKHQKGVKK